VAIVGRPNVGKSSMVNALLGVERNIVTPIAGTTRDSIHTHYKAFGHEYLLIDTAGIRKKGKVTEDIEFYSVIRAIRAIEECDVCVLMLDAKEGIESQDLSLFHQAEKNGKGIVVLVNKWDLMEKETNSAKEFEESIKRKTAPFTDYPVLFVSAHNKQRIYKAMETIAMVYHNMSKKVSTHELNEIMLPIILNTPPPAYKGKYIRIKYITQLRTKVSTFAFFCNLPQYFKDPYKRFLENKLRENFDFQGVPIRIFFRKK
jgi:GTP-binding protein